MTIERFHASCACTSIFPQSLTIGPNSSGKVELTLDLTVGDDKESIRRFEVSVHPVFSGFGLQYTPWVITGTAEDPYAMSPRVVDVAEVLSGDLLPTETVVVTPAVPLKHLEVRADAPLVAEFNNAARSGDNGHYTLTLRSGEPLSLGQFDRQVWLYGTYRDGHTLPPTPISVMGRVVPDVAVHPEAIYAGFQPVGSTFETQLTLKSRTGTPFEIASSEQPEDGNRIEELYSATSSSTIRTVRLALDVRLTSDHTLTLPITVRAATTREEVQLEVPVVYYGGMPNRK